MGDYITLAEVLLYFTLFTLLRRLGSSWWKYDIDIYQTTQGRRGEQCDSVDTTWE